MKTENISAFMRHHFRHFNAAAVVDAAEDYLKLMESGGHMLVTLGGAMSTAELGLSLAEMIRQGKVHAVSCTGANLEEDIFNLVAHNDYVRIPHYRNLSPQDEKELLDRHLNRVTDTCIPELEAIKRIEKAILEEWVRADQAGERYFPHEYFYRLLRTGQLERYYQIDPRDSWIIAASERDLPVFVPGWEDSTIGNSYAGHCMRGTIRNVHTVRTGIEYMISLAEWYQEESRKHPIGFLQVGGGISGDFGITVVPMLRQDLGLKDTPLWAYFCQISESATSYGSYSGATPNEKITWEKLGVETPKHIIESDATIVVPLLFAYVLERSCT